MQSTETFPLPEDLFKVLKELIQLSLCGSESIEATSGNWSLFAVENNTRIWSKKSHKWGHVSFKASTIVPKTTSAALAELICDPSKRKEWDPLLMDCRLVESIKPTLNVIYLAYEPNACCSWPRDYVIRQYLHTEADGTLIIAYHSTQSDQCPPATWTTVRGEMHGGFILKQVNSDVNLCHVWSNSANGIIQYYSSYFHTTSWVKRMQSIHGVALLSKEQNNNNNDEPAPVERAAEQVIVQRVPSVKIPSATQSNQSSPRPRTPPSAQQSSSNLEPIEYEDVEIEEEIEVDDDSPAEASSAADPLANVPMEYAPGMEAAVKSLLELGLASDEWKYITEDKGIKIYKRELSGSALSYAKGIGVIPAPVDAILDLLRDISRRGEWDEMYKEGSVIENYNSTTLLLKMGYNGIWPTTGRDFVTLIHGRELPDGRSIVAAKSVEHPKCPENKAYVRGEVIVGGYIIAPSKDKMSCTVTYLQCADLKGSVPARIVALATTKMPMVLDGLRRVLAKSDLLPYIRKLKEAQSQKPKKKIMVKKIVKRPKPKPAPVEPSNENNIENNSNNNNENNQNKTPEDSEHDNHDSDNLSVVVDHAKASHGNTDHDEEESEGFVDISRNSSSVSLNDSAVLDNSQTNSPMMNRRKSLTGTVDFSSLIQVSLKSLLENCTSNAGWKSIGVKHDVVILRKEPKEGQAIYSFKGIGEIPVPAEKVKELCLDFNKAKDFDGLLKTHRLVDQIDDVTQVVQLMYQTRMCIVKTARDFCVLYHEHRREDGAYALVARSVVHPSCPPVQGYTRAEVLESGFFIRPKASNKNSSLVVYISQVDLKGIPPSVINIIAEKQPLVIAGIRKVLTGSRDLIINAPVQ